MDSSGVFILLIRLVRLFFTSNSIQVRPCRFPAATVNFGVTEGDPLNGFWCDVEDDFGRFIPDMLIIPNIDFVNLWAKTAKSANDSSCPIHLA